MATIAGIGGIGGRALAARLGRVGVWSFALQRLTAADEGAAMREYERLGYLTVWVPESVGSKEVFAHSALLLSGSERAIVAPGIASIYARDPMAMAGGARALAEAYPGRFVLGIGVSHAPSVQSRGHEYGKPVETMRAYLDAMNAASYAGPEMREPVPLVLAALGPRMLELASARADGAHPYFVPVEHTPFARKAVGDEACLAVEQTAVLSKKIDEGPGKTRATEQRDQRYRTSRATSLWHPVEQKCDAFASSCFFGPHDEEGESSKTNVTGDGGPTDWFVPAFTKAMTDSSFPTKNADGDNDCENREEHGHGCGRWPGGRNR